MNIPGPDSSFGTMVPGLACAVMLTAAPAVSADVEWIVAPYIWASDLSIDATINDQNQGGDIAFSDLVDKIDAAFMGHAEVRGSRWGAFVDAIYVDLKDSTTRTINPGPGPGIDVRVDSDIDLGVYEFGGLYRFGEAAPGGSEVDLLFGARTVDVDLDINITGPGSSITDRPGRGVDRTETDIFAGARLIGLFNERWGYKARIDYGAGGTEGSFNTFATLSYNFFDGAAAVDVGYRYMKIEVDSSGGDISTEVEMEMSGPLVGFILKF